MGIFNLKDENSELRSSNGGVSQAKYAQISSSRDVTLNNFANGNIHFKWSQSGLEWWLPYQSKIRMRNRLAKANGDGLTLADAIAPTMGLCSSLFQSAEFRLNGTVISRVSDFMPQIDALEHRLMRSKSWLDSVGSVTNFWDDSFKARQSAVCRDYDNSMSVGFVTERSGAGTLGYDAATNTFEVSAAGILTFTQAGGAALPVLADTFQAGDEIELDVGGVVGTVRYIISAVTGAQTLQLNNLVHTVIGANTGGFRRIRTEVTRSDYSRKVTEFELVWSPPLSIFKVKHAMPCGEYELMLTPQTQSVYQKYAIESLVDKVPNRGTSGAPSAGSNYQFNVIDMYLYNSMVDGPRVTDKTYLLDLEQTRIQSDGIGTTSFQSKTIDVSPSTYALTVMYQDLRAGTDSRMSPTKFKVHDTAGNPTNEELKLNRFYLKFAGLQLPQPDADPNFVPVDGIDGSIDFTTQRYTESLLNSASFHDTGGSETLQEFHNRGSYYHFQWPRDASSTHTKVTINQQFQSTADVSQMRVLLADHSRSVCRVQIIGGKVVNVECQEA
jgi:hypothetical protein